MIILCRFSRTSLHPFRHHATGEGSEAAADHVSCRGATSLSNSTTINGGLMERDFVAKDQAIPDIVIRRLPIYARGLRHLLNSGHLTVSSNELADAIGVTAAQIRRDLSYFGRFGKQGKGYDVPTLIEAVQEILNIDRHWDVALA